MEASGETIMSDIGRVLVDCKSVRDSPRTYPALPNPHASTPTRLAERLAEAIAALAPASVALIGDDIQLAEALTARGLVVIRGDEAQASSAALAVVRAHPPHVDEVLGKLDPDVRRVLLWHEGDVPVTEWASAAGGAGYFRSADPAPNVRDATCLLVDAGQPATVELVTRYEALLSGAPDLDAELRRLRHRLLTSRDHAIGAEAEISRLRNVQSTLEGRIAELYATTTWRVGTRLIGPLGRMRRTFRR
jgi:hypothetical protein